MAQMKYENLVTRTFAARLADALELTAAMPDLLLKLVPFARATLASYHQDALAEVFGADGENVELPEHPDEIISASDDDGFPLTIVIRRVPAEQDFDTYPERHQFYLAHYDQVSVALDMATQLFGAAIDELEATPNRKTLEQLHAQFLQLADAIVTEVEELRALCLMEMEMVMRLVEEGCDPMDMGIAWRTVAEPENGSLPEEGLLA